MTEKMQVWKCNVCGNVVEVLHDGADSLVCCGQSMELKDAKLEEEGREKHKPVVEGRKIKIGSEPHPMKDDHYIEWVEVQGEDGRSSRIFLKPGDAPEVEASFNPTLVRAYCNVHGLWRS